MNFSDRLDYLMNLTKTSNKELAEVLFFSQSYVSKLRRGHRSLKDIESIENICEFFSNRIFLPCQLDGLEEKFEWGKLPVDPSSHEIALFLMENFFSEKPLSLDLLDEVFYSTIEIPSLDKKNTPYKDNDLIKKNINIEFNYQQNKNKYLKFLNNILLGDKIGYVFYYSNSYHLSYNYDLDVVSKIEEVMNHIIKNNIKFDIVLNLGLPINETLGMFENWFKYMFYDNIRIYYMSNGNGNYITNTLFGAHSVGVFNSYGIKGTIDYETIVVYEGYIEYKKMEEQFYKILSKAVPVALKYNPKDYNEQLDYSKLLLKNGKNTTVSKYLSVYSMPKDLLEELLDNPGFPNLLEITTVLQEEIYKSLENNIFIEIVDNSLLDVDTFESGSYWGYKYTIPQFKRHLESLLDRLETQENYYFLVSDCIDPYKIFHINKDQGALVISNEKTANAIFSSSKTVTSILDNYVKFKFLKTNNSLEELRKKSIDRLKTKIESLK